jgi:nucleoside-diphosphate-sugar epimerase
MANENKLVLVTGGSGFVAIHCIVQLLGHGYKVRATLRSIAKQNEVLGMLGEAGIGSLDRIEFIEADLTDDRNWNKAAENCEFVLHVASPIYLRAPKHEDEMIRPAVDGTLRVLTAARNAGVKRVVMTSNFGAVGYSHTDKARVITEACWTDPDEKGLSIYNKSKVLAERAAWDFVKREGGTLELSVINPMGIFGPSYSPVLSSGFEMLKRVLDGSMKRIPNITLGIVDVRDVADLHLRAMESPEANGERFLALAGGILSLPEIAQMLKRRAPAIAKDASLKTVPDWMVKIVAWFNPVARNIVPMLSRYRNASNEKAKQLLGWQPRTNEEAILATAESLVKFGALKN